MKKENKEISLPAGRQVTKSASQTQKIGADFAFRLASLSQDRNSAVIIGLEGDLGSGKTTFLQGFAKGLEIKEKVLSPTFVVLKHFKITKKIAGYADFYHIDCYRLDRAEEILDLGWEDISKNPNNVIAIEWPEKIKKILPKNVIRIKFKFIEKEKREIIFV